jgi:hypothetical protein
VALLFIFVVLAIGGAIVLNRIRQDVVAVAAPEPAD